MPKPIGITRQHILSAIEYINQEGIPPQNDATVHVFEYEGKTYPALYVVRVAESFQKYNSKVDPLPKCDYNSYDASDILRKNQFYTKRALRNMKIWKISHGVNTIKPASLREALRNRQVVTMGANTEKHQGEYFINDVAKGDIFYLCYTNSVQLIGVITSEQTSPNMDMGGDYLERSYAVLYEAKEGSVYPANGLRKGWTPNYTSTLFEIKKNSYSDFEKNILEPYFGITLEELFDKANHTAITESYCETKKSEKKANMSVNKNTILYGPPGTGKTYHTAIYAVAICDPDDATLDELKGKAKKKEEYDKIYNRYQELITEGRVKFTTFHQSYGYEDFIEGIKPDIDDKGNIVYKVKSGVFKQFCCDDSQNKVFIIDEINRGNISKIFGELITLIEDDKRGTTYVTLPLSPDEKFTVPEKVYILGTMNTADRSIALMDTALRRRFTFVEMMPEPKVFVKNGVDVVIDDVNIRLLLEAMNERIEYLYDREHTIGHAYFKEFIDGKGSISDLRVTFKNKIIPLLQEYFYDDYEKIALVLNDDNASNKFIKTKNVPAEWLGKQYDEGDKYDINPEIWNKEVDFSARLRAIYEKKQKNQTEETGE